MTVTLPALMAKLGLDSTEYESGMDSAEGRADNLGTAFTDLGLLGGAALAGIGAALAGIGAGMAFAAGEAMEAQDAQVLLNGTWKNTQAVTGVTQEQLYNLASGYQEVTKFSDEMVMGAESVLTRFDTINSETFPDALGLSLDLATAMGVDASTGAMTLGKALADPGQGLLRLKQAGAVFTDEEEKLIESMTKAGDTAGAQALILDVVRGSVGGLAEEAGKTASGQLTILQNRFSDMAEQVGGPLIDGLSELANVVMDQLNKPEVAAFIDQLTTAIGEMVTEVVENLPAFIKGVQGAFGWLMDNKGVIVAGVAVIGVAIITFLYGLASAAITAAVAMWPFLLVVALIGAAAYLLYEAWTNNWGGIQEKTAAVLAWLAPYLEQLQAWFAVAMPVALQWLSDIWTGVLLPAIQAVGNWINTVLVPAIANLANWFTTVLIPAIAAVWSFITTYLWPLFVAVANFMGAVFGVAITALAGLWQNVLQPALQTVWSFISTNVLPLLQKLDDFLTATFGPTLTTIATFIGTTVVNAFTGLKMAIQWVIDLLKKMTDALKNIKLPKVLTPGSPTPFEIGLRGIADAMSEVNDLATDTRFDAPGITVSKNTSLQAPIQLVYSPTLSTANRDELQSALFPFIERGMRQVGA